MKGRGTAGEMAARAERAAWSADPACAAFAER